MGDLDNNEIIWRKQVHMTIIDILVWARVMVFNATLNNISAISWHSVLFVEETEYSEKITDLSQITDKPYRIMCHRVLLIWVGFELTTLGVIDTDCISSNKPK
jgi:uncharacterized membrane protein YjgN (DUF898 family)